MKKIVLTVAALATIILGFSSCKNASMQCWEYSYTVDSKLQKGYEWCTQDQAEYQAYQAKKESIAVTYKKASSYKTAEDCFAADRKLNDNK